MDNPAIEGFFAMQEHSGITYLTPIPVQPLAANARLGGEFKTGDEIMKCDPMVKCLSRKFMASRCYHCFKEDLKVKCSDCLVPRYCSSDCLSLDKAKAHSFECALWKNSPEFCQFCLEDDVRLLMLRLYASMELNKDLHFQLWPSTFSTSKKFADVLLRPEVNIYSSDSMQTCRTMANVIGAIFSKPKLDHWSLNSLYGVVRQKRIKIPAPSSTSNPMIDPSLNTVIGWGIFVIPALLEHDCRPNAIVVHVGSDIVIRAIRDIGVTDMPRISYLRGHDDLWHRTIVLQCLYNLRCDCHKCTHKTDADVDMINLQNLLKKMDDIWRRPIILPNDFHAACDICNSILSMFGKMYEEHDEHVTMLYRKMYSIAINSGVDMNNLKPLFDAAIKHMEITYGVAFPV